MEGERVWCSSVYAVRGLCFGCKWVMGIEETVAVFVAVQIKVEKEEVQRLLKLPCELQLALPFLHSPDQLHAHRLLMHYSFMKGTSIDCCRANRAPSGR